TPLIYIFSQADEKPDPPIIIIELSSPVDSHPRTLDLALDRTGYKTIRRSPSRRVTRSRSKYSSNGIAYFREMPANSLNAGTSMERSLLCEACSRRRRVKSSRALR